MPRWLLRSIYATIIVVGVLVSVWFIAEGWKSHESSRSAAVIGALLVAVGWMVTSQNTLQNSAKDHTIRVLSEYLSKDAKDRWKTIREFVPRPSTLKIPGESDEYKDPGSPVYMAVDDQLDAYDFIAIGVRHGVYNDSMLESALKPNFWDLNSLAGDYINYTRAQTQDDEIWADFTSLCAKWKASESVPGEPWPKHILRRAWAEIGYNAGFLKRT